MKNKGLHHLRIKSNPEEKRFAEAWKKFAESRNLAWLLHTGPQTGYPPDIEERDAVVAATVIQWLGSPVGQHWLRELSYMRLEEK